MLSEFTITLLQLGLLLVLWLFVLTIIGVLRRDLFGTKLVQRAPAAKPAAATAAAGGTAAPGAAAQAPPQPAKGDPRHLTVVEGSMVGTTIDLATAPILIGRAPECSLVLTDDYSSGRHLRIFTEQGRWFAEDLDSTNGTFMGRDQINGTIPIYAGTQLRIGRTVLELRR